MRRCRPPWRAEPVLAADETPVNLLDPHAGLAGQDAGAPHVLVVRTPHRRADLAAGAGLPAAAAITAVLAFFTGFLISDGYAAYQQLLPQLAGVQQCCQHVIRRARAVTKLGPGSLQSWAADVIDILREAHQAVEEALARGDPALGRGAAGEAAPALRRGRRLRDHPQPAAGLARRQPPRLHPRLLAARLQRSRSGCSPAQFAVEWTNNCSEQAVKGRQTPPGRLRVLARIRIS